MNLRFFNFTIVKIRCEKIDEGSLSDHFRVSFFAVGSQRSFPDPIVDC